MRSLAGVRLSRIVGLEPPLSPPTGPVISTLGLSAGLPSPGKHTLWCPIRTSPVQQNAVPVQQTAMPGRRHMVPVEQNMVPVQQNVMPVQQNMVPVQQNLVPAQQNTAPKVGTKLQGASKGQTSNGQARGQTTKRQARGQTSKGQARDNARTTSSADLEHTHNIGHDEFFSERGFYLHTCLVIHPRA